MEDTETLRRVALSSILGGAAGLRVNSAAHVRAMRADTGVPIIAIEKSYLDGQLRITPDFDSAAALVEAGADIIAMDCTDRPYLHGEPWREILHRIHAELHVLVMADVATYAEGMAAAEAGADLIGTTLHGYTRETAGAVPGFNWELMRALARDCGKPVVAEGNIATPEEARRALEEGAWTVVVGSAITRPGVITASFVQALQREETELCVIGVDIGGTAVKAALVDRAGVMTLPVSVPTSAKGGRSVIAASTAEAIRLVLESARAANLAPAAIGIASAGAIDSSKGIVYAATENLPGWAGFNLRGFVEEKFGLPAFVENDAQAAVLAELHFGVGRGLSSFVALTLGTGVGGGVVMDGKLQRGHHGFAGTFGHQTIRIGGRSCNCGRSGCLEAYVSTAALVQEYETATGVPRLPNQSDAEIARRISELAARGDLPAIHAYDVLSLYLAEGVANIFNMLDPEAVIVSGGLIEDHPTFLPALQKRVRAHLHFGEKRAPRILRAKAGYYAGTQGAAVSAFEGLRNRDDA
jgi:glucokinase-like ROK family protein